jgi:hypothetical protein
LVRRRDCLLALLPCAVVLIQSRLRLASCVAVGRGEDEGDQQREARLPVLLERFAPRGVVFGAYGVQVVLGAQFGSPTRLQFR